MAGDKPSFSFLFDHFFSFYLYVTSTQQQQQQQRVAAGRRGALLETWTETGALGGLRG